MVAIPVSIDQPGVAARISYTRTGAYVLLQDLTASRLSTLIDKVLNNPEYRLNANTMREAIIRAKGLEKAADLLEEAFNLPQQPPDVNYRLNISERALSRMSEKQCYYK
jgi:UDP:flavonoid glycosyltransferase YjiC (YdhE family)